MSTAPVWLLEGPALTAFYRGIDGDLPPGVVALRLTATDEGVRVRVNEAAWSPPLGVAE